MIQRLSWPGATRWQQISARLSWATLFSLLIIYVVFYGLIFLLDFATPASFQAHLSFLSPIIGFAPNGNGSFDPSDIILGGIAFPLRSDFYLADHRVVGTILYCLPLLLAAVAWITATVDMVIQRQRIWISLSIAAIFIVFLNPFFIQFLQQSLHLGDGTPPEAQYLNHVGFWCAAIEEQVILYLPWLVAGLYLIAMKSQRQRAIEVALTVLASFALACLSLLFYTTTGPFKYYQEGSWLSYFTAGFPLPFIFNFPALNTYSFFIPLYLFDVAFFYGVVTLAKAAVAFLRKRSLAHSQQNEVGTNPL